MKRFQRSKSSSGKKRKRRKITNTIISKKKRSLMSILRPWHKLLRKLMMIIEYWWRKIKSSKFSFWVKRTIESFSLSSWSTRKKKALDWENCILEWRSKLIKSNKQKKQMKPKENLKSLSNLDLELKVLDKGKNSIFHQA